MKYFIIAEQYDFDYSDSRILGTCKNKKQAKAIVKRLEREDEKEEFIYSYELIKQYNYTGKYKTVRKQYVEPVFDLSTPTGRMEKLLHDMFRKTLPIDTGNLKFNAMEYVGTDKAGTFKILGKGIVADYTKIEDITVYKKEEL